MNSRSHLCWDQLPPWAMLDTRFLFVCSKTTLSWLQVEWCRRWGKPRSSRMRVKCWTLPRTNGLRWQEWISLELRHRYVAFKTGMCLPSMVFWRAKLELIVLNILTWEILIKHPLLLPNGSVFQSRTKISSWTSQEVAHTSQPAMKSSSSVEYVTNASTWTSLTSNSLPTVNLSNKAGLKSKSLRYPSTSRRARMTDCYATPNSAKIPISSFGHLVTTCMQSMVRLVTFMFTASRRNSGIIASFKILECE